MIPACTQTLRQLGPYRKMVVATGGGAVLRTTNWGHMQQGVVIWLCGPPSLLARRVVKDGVERRPLLAGEGVTDENRFDKTVEKLEGILEERRRFYESADLVVSLEGHGEDEALGAPTAVVMYRLMLALNDR